MHSFSRFLLTSADLETCRFIIPSEDDFPMSESRCTHTPQTTAKNSVREDKEDVYRHGSSHDPPSSKEGNGIISAGYARSLWQISNIGVTGGI